MEVFTEIVVLKSIKYLDKHLVVHAYSKEFGPIAFIVHGAFRSKAKIKPVYFLSGTLLSVNVSYKQNKNLQIINDLQINTPLFSCHQSVLKNAILTLICELLQKTLKEESPNESLFSFISSSILFLDKCEEDYSNFHLIFMLQLSRYLGFYPNQIEGVLPNANILDSNLLVQLLQKKYTTMQEVDMSRSSRNNIVEIMIKYFHKHLGIGTLQSHKILKELFE